MNRLYPDVAARAMHRCEYCRAPERFFNFAFEVEHILPEVKGGDDESGNLALSCLSCNRYKGMATTGYDAEENRDVPLFHPRLDDWFLHFRFDVASTELHGRTGKGRVTVARLQMNSPFQIKARQLWIASGLYP